MWCNEEQFPNGKVHTAAASLDAQVQKTQKCSHNLKYPLSSMELSPMRMYVLAHMAMMQLAYDCTAAAVKDALITLA